MSQSFCHTLTKYPFINRVDAPTLAVHQLESEEYDHDGFVRQGQFGVGVQQLFDHCSIANTFVTPKNIQTINIRKKNLNEKRSIVEVLKCSIVKALKRKNDIMKSTYYL
ncbi:MAG: hypothetical protein WCG25_01495 [bacterium]